jgi:tetratricopeptide (TPR) repeat protein
MANAADHPNIAKVLDAGATEHGRPFFVMELVKGIPLTVANAYLAAGKIDLALPLCNEALALRRSKLGADHPDTISSMNNLANAYLAAGKLDLAVPLFEKTLALDNAKLGGDHPDTLKSKNDLATGHLAAGRLDLAMPRKPSSAPNTRSRWSRCSISRTATGLPASSTGRYVSSRKRWL